MAGINHVTGKWWWIPGTRGLKRGCPMKDGKIDNKIIISWNRNQVFYLLNSSDVAFITRLILQLLQNLSAKMFYHHFDR